MLYCKNSSINQIKSNYEDKEFAWQDCHLMIKFYSKRLKSMLWSKGCTSFRFSHLFSVFSGELILIGRSLQRVQYNSRKCCSTKPFVKSPTFLGLNWIFLTLKSSFSQKLAQFSRGKFRCRIQCPHFVLWELVTPPIYFKCRLTSPITEQQ